jgi:hypothetical protein
VKRLRVPKEGDFVGFDLPLTPGLGPQESLIAVAIDIDRPKDLGDSGTKNSMMV